MLCRYVATAPQSIPRGEVLIAMADPCFISFLKPFRVLNIVVFLGKGREEVEVGGCEMITLHLGSKETSLSCNYISLRLSDAHLNVYIVWQNE